MISNVGLQELKGFVATGDPVFWPLLSQLTHAASKFEQLLVLSSLRKKAHLKNIPRAEEVADPIRIGLIGGYSLYPLSELLTHCLDAAGVPIELLTGDYDNYMSEVADTESSLQTFQPQTLCILPSPRLGQPSGRPLDTRQTLEAEAMSVVNHLLGLCATAHERIRCEVALANFPLPGRHDIGAFRGRTLSSDWSFRKLVNLELGLGAPAYVHVCDLEFITNRLGALHTTDDRGWFESKQPGSPQLLVDLAREFASIVLAMRCPPKKVLVLDLDNTLWGGVIGDDGLERIEIGDTSARGEAYKDFQRYVKTLKDRGVLLAVCSKNDHAKAAEPFEKHPEMVLRMEDFSAFIANWEPKSDNIRRMAVELNLGLDSFVFVDDNAAEIEIVRQFAPEVTSIHLGEDPAEYRAIVQDCRMFEPLNITADDSMRTEQYHSEQNRKALLTSSVDMDLYLASLDMVGTVSSFSAVDVPRLSQLINKSNQFNLTTHRRTEAEVTAVMNDPAYACFSVRLKDRFGDHGLIAIVIGNINGSEMIIDTWLMSCRVLKREVEHEVLNLLVQQAVAKGCSRLVGVFLATPKNEMVKKHFPGLGFNSVSVTPERAEYSLDVEAFELFRTHIRMENNFT